LITGNLLVVTRFGADPDADASPGRINGTPASKRASVPPQTEAIEVEPLDSMIFTGDTNRVRIRVQWNHWFNAAFGKSAVPDSRRPGRLMRPVSPTEKFGKVVMPAGIVFHFHRRL